MLSRSQRTHLKVFVLSSWTKVKNQQHTQPTDSVDLHTTPPPYPNPWFEHRPQWWKTSALITMPFETENYLTKHEVVLLLFRCHYSLQRVSCGTMVSKVLSAHNRYLLTIPNIYSEKFRFSRNCFSKDYYCGVIFLLALSLNNLLKVCHVLTLIQPRGVARGGPGVSLTPAW